MKFKAGDKVYVKPNHRRPEGTLGKVLSKVILDSAGKDIAYSILDLNSLNIGDGVQFYARPKEIIKLYDIPPKKTKLIIFSALSTLIVASAVVLGVIFNSEILTQICGGK